MQEVAKEIEANEKVVLSRFSAVVNCNERLDEIANRGGSLTLLQHINQQMVRKKEDGEERIKSLKRIRLLCVINSLNTHYTV